ncbi:hypothetical protein [Nitrosovibrio tenuis]|uniref:Uncharacterized protein n=1 Tax=Nitrosovibrio tenuis TaxID=1233 RepID=A0A1H7RXR8_9PROT|nr:hypothetical protein [Nitrosovibrio tenuis]SEL64906.1 hypothetical protein SAMN05216387_12115 [Nitrosovibrio tenuis]
MPFLNRLTLPIALIISSLIIGYALLENGRNNRFKLSAYAGGGFAFKIDSYTGKAELCKISPAPQNTYQVTCGENISD